MDKRGYRRAVRVIVTRDGKIALGVRYEKDGVTPAYYLFPGGGVEDNETLTQAAVKEVKEEVGMLVKDAREIGHRVRYDKEFPQPDRAKLYRGSEDIWLTAIYVRSDKTLHGKAGDAFKYDWVTPDEAVQIFSRNLDDVGNVNKIKAVEIFKEFIAKRQDTLSVESIYSPLPCW